MSRPTTPAPDLVALAAAPILTGVAMLLDLTPFADGTGQLLALVEQSPERWAWANFVFLLAAVAWTMAGVGLFRRLGGQSRSITLGAVALAAGGASLGLIEATMTYIPSLAQSGASLAEQVALVEQVDAATPAVALEIVHVVGWMSGLLLVVTGLLRTRVVPRWVPTTLLAGLVGVLVFVTGPGLAIASAAMAAGTTALAVHLARLEKAASRTVVIPSSVDAA